MGFLFGRCLVFLLRGGAFLRLVGLFGVFRTNAEAARLGTFVLIVLETGRRLILLVLVLGRGEVLLTRWCSHGGGFGTARVLRAGLGWALPCWTRGVQGPPEVQGVVGQEWIERSRESTAHDGRPECVFEN